MYYLLILVFESQEILDVDNRFRHIGWVRQTNVNLMLKLSFTGIGNISGKIIYILQEFQQNNKVYVCKCVCIFLCVGWVGEKREDSRL